MKKFKILLVILLTILLIPFGVLADEKSSESTKDREASTEEKVSDKKVNLYFFNGNGCGHCANAEAWFEEIEDEYGEYFNLVSYEVWYNDDNNDLMQRVGELREENVSGVPYIIIGNQSWNGFDDDYKEQILSKIKSEYEQDPADRYDIMNYVSSLAVEKEGYGSDILALIIIIVVFGIVVAGIILARKKTN